jgi:streptomycin 6-kinase
MIEAPADLARTVVELHGAEGVEWLRRLGGLLGDCAERWSLSLLPPFDHLTYNYVAPAILDDGTDVVVKAGVPNAELAAEIEALRLFDGRAAVRLLEADRKRGVLLLERLKPGSSLRYLSDEVATSAAVKVMQGLWKPAPLGHPFPTVGDWASGLARLRAQFAGTGPLPSQLVERAERVFAELMASMDDPVLLHGDLHHMNILAAEREPWLAIDPKGVVGEPAYEVGALLRNPMPELLSEPSVGRVLERRVDQLVAETGFERGRVLGWGMAQAVLSGWWSLEDHRHGWEPSIRCAEILATIMC